MQFFKASPPVLNPYQPIYSHSYIPNCQQYVLDNQHIIQTVYRFMVTRSHGAAGSHIARKRFGQHFLVDDQILHAIVEAIHPQADDALIEIGPGLGAMTALILERCDKLMVIEIDRDLGPKLKARFKERIEVIQADVLKVDFASLVMDSNSAHHPHQLRVVGNLPYNISTPLLFHLLPFAAQVQDQLFMLQREVVDRMVAKPCTKDYGRLSVMLQWRYEMRKVLDVPPTAFDPPPRVDSAVVHMRPRELTNAAFSVDLLESLVAAAFSQRRKILRHTLQPWLETRQITLKDFDFQRRAEEVSVEEYLDIARIAQLTQRSHQQTS